jgi:hypothetical protein
MKPQSLAFRLLVCTCLPVAVVAAVDDPGADPGVQLFLQACATTYAHPAEVAKVAAKFGLTEVPASDAQQYLMSKRGRAWRGTIKSKAYAVTALDIGLCTVLLYDGDAARIQAGVASWLPPDGAGVAVKRADISAPPGLSTVNYELRGGNVQERWVVTISSDPSSKVRAMLSWSRL